MDTPFPQLHRGLKWYAMGCFIGLIWFGSLSQILAQTQIPSPLPGKERPESKIESKAEPRLDLRKAEGTEGATPNGSKTAETPAATKLAPIVPAANTLSIGECIRLAHERSPILKSLRIRIESAVVGQKGIEKTSRIIHDLISPDLQYRRLQAANGVTAAETELFQAEHDVTFNVARTYYSAVYAKEQLRLTTDLEKTLKEYLQYVKDAVAEGSVRTLDKKTEEVFVQYVTRAIDKRIQAESGYKRAMQGLRHEIGMEDSFDFTPADEVLPEVNAVVNGEHAVAHALSRRGEIALARIGVDVLELEVQAQGALRFRLRQSTAAAASDVHSRTVPTGSRDGEYRPDAIAPDFPTLIVGDRKIRAERATSLLHGQEALFEKTRDLVKLETLNAVIKYEEAQKRVPEWRIAAEAGVSSVERARRDSNKQPGDSGILTLEGLAAESKGFYNEARYQQLLALATLERATAGGIKVNYPGR